MNYYFNIQPIIAFGYTREYWQTQFLVLKIRKIYFLCFILTIYNYN